MILHSCWCYSQGELLPEAAAVLLLGFDGVEQGQFDDVRPHGRTWRATRPADQLELSNLLCRLEDGLLHEELAQYAPVD